MTDDELQFTKDWWKRCLADPAKLAAWLQKLQITEISGYTDWADVFIPRYRKEINSRTESILTNIALDEMKHSQLLLGLMLERRIKPLETLECQSTYWATMYLCQTDLNTCCAANFFGESLAADRFEVIESMKETPSDIRDVIARILPDEIFHKVTLKKLAGDEAIETMREAHETAVARLKGQPRIVV